VLGTPAVHHNEHAAQGIAADRDEAFFGCVFVRDRHRTAVKEDLDSVGEIDAVLPSVPPSLGAIPLELHAALVYVHQYTDVKLYRSGPANDLAFSCGRCANADLSNLSPTRRARRPAVWYLTKICRARHRDTRESDRSARSY
jgi:hypothetical protein